jgi:hypothetical protein
MDQNQTVVQKLEQREAVFKFITEALSEDGKTLAEFKILMEQDKKQLQSLRKVVRQRLFTSIRSGETRLGKEYDDSRLKKYCSGLINNWVAKDPRFK